MTSLQFKKKVLRVLANHQTWGWSGVPPNTRHSLFYFVHLMYSLFRYELLLKKNIQDPHDGIGTTAIGFSTGREKLIPLQIWWARGNLHQGAGWGSAAGKLLREKSLRFLLY